MSRTRTLLRSFKESIKKILWMLIHKVAGQENLFLPVLSGPAKGAWLNLDIRHQGSYFLGTYDRWIFDRVPLHRFLFPGDAAWDCGAFAGYYAAIFRKIVGSNGEVLVFEASLANHGKLKNMPLKNNWRNVTIFHEAVGPEKTQLEFVNDRGGASGPLGLEKVPLAASQGKETILVRSRGIDEILKTHSNKPPKLIKFDLETGEIHALRNGAEVFGSIRPVVLLELHGPEACEAAEEWRRKYEYITAVIEFLPLWKKVSQSDYQKAFKKRAAELGDNIQSIGYQPHMLLCIPKENTGG